MSRIDRTVGMVLACVMALCACSTGAPVRELPPADPVGLALGRPEYRLGPGDLVKIQVFQLPDLEREVRVDNAGRITLPGSGFTLVVGLSIFLVNYAFGVAFGINPRLAADPGLARAPRTDA